MEKKHEENVFQLSSDCGVRVGGIQVQLIIILWPCLFLFVAFFCDMLRWENIEFCKMREVIKFYFMDLYSKGRAGGL